MAENAAPTLFLCSKKIKMLVFFSSFYASARSEEKVRTERFEPIKQDTKQDEFLLMLLTVVFLYVILLGS